MYFLFCLGEGGGLGLCLYYVCTQIENENNIPKKTENWNTAKLCTVELKHDKCCAQHVS